MRTSMPVGNSNSKQSTINPMTAPSSATVARTASVATRALPSPTSVAYITRGAPVPSPLLSSSSPVSSLQLPPPPSSSPVSSSNNRRKQFKKALEESSKIDPSAAEHLAKAHDEIFSLLGRSLNNEEKKEPDAIEINKNESKEVENSKKTKYLPIFLGTPHLSSAFIGAGCTTSFAGFEHGARVVKVSDYVNVLMDLKSFVVEK